MTSLELKKLHEQSQPESTFFSPANMDCFGDRYGNWEVREHSDINILELVRLKPVSRNANTFYWIGPTGEVTCSHFFDSKDFSILWMPDVVKRHLKLVHGFKDSEKRSLYKFAVDILNQHDTNKPLDLENIDNTIDEMFIPS